MISTPVARTTPVSSASDLNRLYDRGHRSKGFGVTRIERAARAMCRFHGLPENTKFEGRPMWESYLDEARAVLAAIDKAEGARNERP